MSIILLALIWFGSELVPVFVVFLIAFPIMAINVIEGVKNIDVKLLEMAKVYNIRFVKRAKDIYFPSILPYMIAGTSNALGIGWKVAISAEVLSHPAFGVGTELYEAKIFLETGMVFAWTLVAIIVGFMLEKLLRILERKLQPWKEL
jgi:NitT/TauT family transport system permease protein